MKVAALPLVMETLAGWVVIVGGCAGSALAGVLALVSPTHPDWVIAVNKTAVKLKKINWLRKLEGLIAFARGWLDSEARKLIRWLVWEPTATKAYWSVGHMKDRSPTCFGKQRKLCLLV
jgi:hypothetical protein